MRLLIACLFVLSFMVSTMAWADQSQPQQGQRSLNEEGTLNPEVAPPAPPAPEPKKMVKPVAKKKVKKAKKLEAKKEKKAEPMVPAEEPKKEPVTQ